MVLSSYLTSDPKMLVCAARPHARTIERVVGIGFQPGLDPAILQSEHLGVRYVKSYLLLLGCLTAFLHILSASEAGEIQFLDMRNGNHVYLTIDAHRGSLTALAVQQHAPLIASGSAKQFIKVFSLEGSQRCTIRFNPTSIARKIGPVSHLTFHPYQASFRRRLQSAH
ncbi:regulatory-associated protein of TOR 1 isoform X4 [Vitis vinifera]|nr:regulatory-associated protein of TOR 1 isoform X4 [Vitis vinifera]|eukprot:XP_010653368.1 PREDICTED: regulatory-associated protein of TOR 1 isoform X2 [Vitis vinifera]